MAIAATLGVAPRVGTASADPAIKRMPSGSVPTVTNCDDDGPGSLRDVLASAADGDQIDLTQLTCSVISLTTGALVTPLNYVFLYGSGPDSLTISANGNSRVIAHDGDGTFSATGMTFSNGSFTSRFANGGCIYSHENVIVEDVVIRDCHVTATPAYTSIARGAGVFARGAVVIEASSVVDNRAVTGTSERDYVFGGGVYARGYLTISNGSTVSGNITEGGLGGYNAGGGAFTASDASILYSTISGNSAADGGGVAFLGSGTASRILDSTISGNSASVRGAGVLSNQLFLEVSNSTIAFNSGQSAEPCGGGGLLVRGIDQYLSLRSSIIANNLVDGMEDDVCLSEFSYVTVMGSHNLIMASNVPLLPDTIHSDPLLAPLADNGGDTYTHALMTGSPAIDQGSNPAMTTSDQRRPFYERVFGRAADIGAFEVQPPPFDVIFRDGFD